MQQIGLLLFWHNCRFIEHLYQPQLGFYKNHKNSTTLPWVEFHEKYKQIHTKKLEQMLRKRGEVCKFTKYKHCALNETQLACISINLPNPDEKYNQLKADDLVLEGLVDVLKGPYAFVRIEPSLEWLINQTEKGFCCPIFRTLHLLGYKYQ